jgi:DnaK suppressor protein
VDAGTYGRCANCGKEIPEERLQAVPYAQFCVNCQKQREQPAM